MAEGSAGTGGVASAAWGGAGPPPTLPRLLRAHAAAHPRDAALWFRAGGRWAPIAWAQLAAAARRVAAFLLAAGVEEQEGVGIWAGGGPEWRIASAAALSMRARTVPIHPDTTIDDAARIIAATGVRVAFADAALAAALLSAGLCPDTRVVAVGDGPGSGAAASLTWAQVLARGEDAVGVRGGEIDRRVAAAAADEVATVSISASGCAAMGGEELSHGALVEAAQALAGAVPGGDARLAVQACPAGLNARLVGEVLPLLRGQCVWLVGRAAASDVRAASPHTLLAEPRAWDEIAAHLEARLAALPWPARAAGRRLARVPSRSRDPVGRAAERMVLPGLLAMSGLGACRSALSTAPVAAATASGIRLLGVEIRVLPDP